jgi:hypothetical protein
MPYIYVPLIEYTLVTIMLSSCLFLRFTYHIMRLVIKASNT